MQVNHLLNVNTLYIIWSKFYFWLWTSFLGNLFFVKYLFYLSWHWFITLSYKLQEVTL